jgi:hypothetical protein
MVILLAILFPLGQIGPVRERKVKIKRRREQEEEEEDDPKF